MQPFIGRVPVSVRFDLTFLFGSLVPIAVGLILGHSCVGQHFVKVLTAEYEGRLLTTDVECEVMSSLDNSVVSTQGQVGRMGHDVGTSINTVHLHSFQRVIARPYLKASILTYLPNQISTTPA